MSPVAGEAAEFRKEMREFKDEVLTRLARLETLVGERHDQQRSSISARSIWAGISLSTLIGLAGIVIRVTGG